MSWRTAVEVYCCITDFGHFFSNDLSRLIGGAFLCFPPLFASSKVELMSPLPRFENNLFLILCGLGCIHQRVDVMNLDPTRFMWKGLCAFLTFWNNFRLAFELRKSG